MKRILTVACTMGALLSPSGCCSDDPSADALIVNTSAKQASEEKEEATVAVEFDECNPTDLGEFVTNKINQKTLDKLWKYLDKDNSARIERGEVLNVLHCMAVLHVAVQFKVCAPFIPCLMSPSLPLPLPLHTNSGKAARAAPRSTRTS